MDYVKKHMWPILIAILAFIAGFFVGVQVAHADDTCAATHDEWSQIDVFMRPFTVADIIGDNGTWLGYNDAGTVFRRAYDVRWDSTLVGVVKYDADSALSINWLVRDRNDEPFC